MNNVKKLFCNITNIPDEEISHIQIIGGMTNNNYLITTKNDGKLVFRISGKNSNLLINRQYEFDNVKSLSSLEITPNIVFYDEEHGNKITNYIESSKTLSPYSISKYIPEIANELAKLHYSGIKFNNEFNFLKEYKKYRNIIIENKIVIDNDFLDIEEKILSLYNILISGGIELCPCHNDLVAENILIIEQKYSNKLFFIDWEYSGMNDPMWDIAALFLENGFTIENENKFLSHYLNNNEPKELEYKKQKIHIYKILQNQLWYLWTLIKENAGDDFGNYRNKRLLSSKELYSDYLKRYAQCEKIN